MMNISAPRENGTRGIPLDVTLHSWPVPPLEPEDNTQTADVDVTRNNVSYRIFNINATSFVASDDDILDTGLSDVQTLILAGLGTLITLFLAVGGVVGLRLLWQRYHGVKDDGYEGVLHRDESSEPDRDNGTQQLKTSESQFTAGTSEEQSLSPATLAPKTNGSVITMTLKNNHLIVETQEAEEAAPSIRIDSRGSTTSYVTDRGVEFPSDTQSSSGKGAVISSENHGALVHRSREEHDEDDKRSCQTGFSQSDLSVSPSGSQSGCYRYGNQLGYDSGGLGYPDTNSDPPPPRPASSSFRDFIRGPSVFDRTDSVISATDVSTYLSSDLHTRIGDDRKESAKEEEATVENGIDSLEGGENSAGISSTNSSNRGPPTSLPIAGHMRSRCDQLRTEPSPLNEVERYPVSAQPSTS